MVRSTFKVLFYLKRQSEQNGKAPIMGRITINGTILQFSCKMSVSPALWDTKANKAAGKSVVAQRINEKLENIKTNIGKHYQCICDRDSYVTAEKVKNAWLGFGDGYQLLIETFDAYLKDFEEKRAGKDRAIGTLVCYRKARNYLAAFLRYEYKIEDIPFKELKREFIERYVVYLSTVRRMLPGSIHTPVKKLKLMTYTAFKNGWITTDPFSSFRISVTYRDRRFLSESELQAVMNVRLPQLQNVHCPGYLRVLLFHGTMLCRRKETLPRRYTHGRAGRYVDHRQTHQDGDAVPGETVARCQTTRRTVQPLAVAGR